MKREKGSRRRPAVHITLDRAARLYRLVATLSQGGQVREALLKRLEIGLRTFYRELVLLRKCGIKVRLDHRQYHLVGTAEEAEGRLPCPDPQLSLAELAELASGTGPAAERLAALYTTLRGQVPTRPARITSKKRH